jgi:hypothetical protein
MEIFWIFGILFKEFTEMKDEIINRAGGREDILTPNMIEDLVA